MTAVFVVAAFARDRFNWPKKEDYASEAPTKEKSSHNLTNYNYFRILFAQN
jgi:hypothetical protein